MTTNNKALNTAREHFLQGLEFKESVLKDLKEQAWSNHPKYKVFVFALKSTLDTHVQMLIKDGYKLINEPLAIGTYPDGRYYQFLLKSDAVLKEEKDRIYKQVRREYLKSLESHATEGLEIFIKGALRLQEQIKTEVTATSAE